MMGKFAAEKWYDQNRGQYEDFMQAVESLLKTLLKEAHVPYHSVNGRVKERFSYIEKCKRKSYECPEQVMDLAGLRVITYTTIEVESVCQIIEDEFWVDQENSGNKAKDMGVDKVGYLSVHYVVRMKPERLNLKEYARFDGLCCEIQVRSLLQHAWAEIEHDRSYKFAGKLPEDIERRFHLVAGNLELLDYEFRILSKQIDQYAERVKMATQEGKLDIPINSTSLLQFMNEFFAGENTEILGEYYHESEEIVQELSDFGIETLKQLKDLLSSQPPHEWAREGTSYTNYLGILRDAMVFQNARKYFEQAWKEHWFSLEKTDEQYWREHGVYLEQLADIVSVASVDDFNMYLSTKKINQNKTAE